MVLIAVAMFAVIVGAHTDPQKVTGTVDTSHLPVLRAAPEVEADGWINSPPIAAAQLARQGRAVRLLDVLVHQLSAYVPVHPVVVRPLPVRRARRRRHPLSRVRLREGPRTTSSTRSSVTTSRGRSRSTTTCTIWNAFENQYWPADYVADRQGNIRYTHFGEGDYDNTENVIRKLLGVPAASPRAAGVTNGETASLEHNPETYLGVQYQSLGQPLIAVRPGTYDYPTPEPGSIAAPRFGADGTPLIENGKLTGALVGKWTVDDEKATSDASVATILLAVHAKEVNLVMATADGHAARRGRAARRSAGPRWRNAARACTSTTTGRRVVTVHAPDMYRLFASPTAENHLISVSTTGPGLEAYDFTFG